MRLPVRDENAVVRVDGEVVWQHELPRVDSRFAPGKHVTPIGSVLVHAGVGVAVTYVNVPRSRRDHGPRRPGEWNPAPGRRRLSRRTDGEQQLALRTELGDRVRT